MIWMITTPAVLVLVVLAVCYYSYRKAFYSPKKNRNKPLELSDNPHRQAAKDVIAKLIGEMNLLPYEEIWITAFDGTKLFGRYYHVKDGAPLQIQFHGYRGTAFRDFSGGNKLARETGFNTLLVDQRAHGKSGGNTISFGIRERLDCKSWAEYAADRFGKDTKILLSGISMGGATVIMASDLELPENVKGIIADCPYSDPKEIIRKVCVEDMKLPRWTLAFAWMGGWIYGKGLRLSESSALKSVANTKLPILILHGESDDFVPCDMSRAIHSTGGDKVTLVTFPEANHGYSFIVDAERYKKVTSEFISKCI